MTVDDLVITVATIISMNLNDFDMLFIALYTIYSFVSK